MKQWLFVAVFFTLAISAAYAQDRPDACPPDVLPRLVVGEQGRRLYDDSNNIRSAPGLSGARVGLLPPGATFVVLDGPQCADGYVWWQIRYGEITGWTAERDPAAGEYWLGPRGQIVTQIGEDGVERVYVEGEDGALEREGCLQPPDDYTRVSAGYAQLNARTLAMLEQANRLYRLRGGRLDLKLAITQGSYTGGALAASFGTHDAGGALDLSVLNPVDGSVLWDEIPLMVDSLRVAGFAAWLRRPDQLYDGSVIHIHAIASGDAELSEAARAQIDGQYGYLRGYDGLIAEYGGPGLDEHGGPIICRWMAEQGFVDMR